MCTKYAAARRKPPFETYCCTALPMDEWRDEVCKDHEALYLRVSDNNECEKADRERPLRIRPTVPSGSTAVLRANVGVLSTWPRTRLIGALDACLLQR